MDMNHETISLTGQQEEGITIKLFPDNSVFISITNWDATEDGRQVASFGATATKELYAFLQKSLKNR